MVGFFTKLWWKGDPDVKDPVSGLSKRDVYHVQKSWAKIYADAPANGYLIFTRLFEADIETKSFFKYLMALTDQEISNNIMFKAHIVYIMSALNAAVENLSAPDLVVPMMHKLGYSHQRLDIKRRHFNTFKEVVMKILENDLKFKPDVIESWDRFISFIYQHIFNVILD